MITSSAKAKGRRLQQYVRDQLINELGIDPADVLSTGMGQSGLDLYLSAKARERFPYGVEAKNVERLNVWDALKQCEANSAKAGLTPLLVIHRNNSKTYAVLELDHLIKTLYLSNVMKEEIDGGLCPGEKQ